MVLLGAKGRNRSFPRESTGVKMRKQKTPMQQKEHCTLHVQLQAQGQGHVPKGHTWSTELMAERC